MPDVSDTASHKAYPLRSGRRARRGKGGAARRGRREEEGADLEQAMDQSWPRAAWEGGALAAGEGAGRGRRRE